MPRADAGTVRDMPPTHDAPRGSTPQAWTAAERALRERLLAGGLRMHVQPIVDLATGATQFVEGLARLEMEDGTLVLPGRFLPLLSDSEVAWLFRRALEQVLGQLAEWDRTGVRLRASINLAPSTLREPDCAQWVLEALERHDIASPRLALEVLETADLQDSVQLEALAELDSLGVTLAMDDLGASYSGIRRLLSVPFDMVKVDVEILAQVRNRPVPTLAILHALIGMGRDLDCDVVIEGLEDEALTEVATILGAPYGQGFHLCPPVPVTGIPQWLERPSPLPDPGAVRTRLGALAYHWSFQRVRQPHPTSHDACPITQLLSAEEDPAVIAWHREQHVATAGQPESGRALLAWLVECSRTDGRPPES